MKYLIFLFTITSLLSTVLSEEYTINTDIIHARINSSEFGKIWITPMINGTPYYSESFIITLQTLIFFDYVNQVEIARYNLTSLSSNVTSVNTLIASTTNVLILGGILFVMGLISTCISIPYRYYKWSLLN